MINNNSCKQQKRNNTESHKTFQLFASSTRPHAKLEAGTKKKRSMHYASKVQSSKT